MAVHLSMIGVFRARKQGRYSATVVIGHCGNNGVYKRHGGSVPFSKGCHDSGGVCIPLVEPARISLPLIRTFSICFRIHSPRLRHTPEVHPSYSLSPFLSLPISVIPVPNPPPLLLHHLLTSYLALINLVGEE